MAYSYSLRALRSIPDLIPACIKILKDEWPQCKAELLPKLVKQERKNAPCSYGLVHHLDNAREKDTLVGHFRLIPVINRERALYSESMCVKRSKRGRGIGGITVGLIEEWMEEKGYAELYLGTSLHRKDYFLRRSYSICDKPPNTLGANLLHTKVAVGTAPCFVSWPGNVLYPGWESEYEGGVIATEKDMMEDGRVRFVKKLNGSKLTLRQA